MRVILTNLFAVLFAVSLLSACSGKQRCNAPLGAYIKGHVHLKFCCDNIEMHVTDGNSTTTVFALDAGMNKNKIRIHVEVVTNGAPEARVYKIPEEGIATLSVETETGTEIYDENPVGKIKIVKISANKMYGFFFFEASCLQNNHKKIKSKGWFKYPE